MKIKIDNIDYELDVTRAKEHGTLKQIPSYPLLTGDVYNSGGSSSLLLIKPFFHSDKCFLIGRMGLYAYSNPELQDVLTPNEASRELTKGGYIYSHNINENVIKAMK